MQGWIAALDHVVLNIVVFVGFFLCASLHHFVLHKKVPTAAESFWHGMLAGVLSPAGMDAARDFLVHLVVYSGYVIPSH